MNKTFSQKNRVCATYCELASDTLTLLTLTRSHTLSLPFSDVILKRLSHSHTHTHTLHTQTTFFLVVGLNVSSKMKPDYLETDRCMIAEKNNSATVSSVPAPRRYR